MFTDSGICWVIWCVSAFAFRWVSLQGVGDLDSVDLQSFQKPPLLKLGRLDSKTAATPCF